MCKSNMYCSECGFKEIYKLQWVGLNNDRLTFCYDGEQKYWCPMCNAETKPKDYEEYLKSKIAISVDKSLVELFTTFNLHVVDNETNIFILRGDITRDHQIADIERQLVNLIYNLIKINS